MVLPPSTRIWLKRNNNHSRHNFIFYSILCSGNGIFSINLLCKYLLRINKKITDRSPKVPGGLPVRIPAVRKVELYYSPDGKLLSQKTDD